MRLHEIEQIAMRSVCLEISSNMFMILFRVEIDFSVTKNFSFRKFALYGGSRCLVELSRRQRGARGCLQNKKNLAYSNNNKFVQIITSVRTVLRATKFTTPGLTK